VYGTGTRDVVDCIVIVLDCMIYLFLKRSLEDEKATNIIGISHD